MRPIGCPEKSVINYHYVLRNNPEDGSSEKLLLLYQSVLCEPWRLSELLLKIQFLSLRHIVFINHLVNVVQK
jgi:hypothetical protein